MNEPLIRLDNITIAYERFPALRNVSASITAGSLTAVAGPNGAGKSTLLKAIMGEVRPNQGRIVHRLEQVDFAYLRQAADINRRFPISVLDLVLLGAWNRTGAFKGVDRSETKRALTLLGSVGLDGFEHRHIASLSSGQFQRVVFARLLLQNASIILLDEPFTGIDASTTGELIQIVIGWHREGRTVVAVLHDFDQVRAHFPETILIARELVACGATAKVLENRNLLRARAMAECWDD